MSDIPTTVPESVPRVPPVLVEAPLPPAMAEKTAAQQRLEVRVWCTFVFVICAAMFGLALYLTPHEGLHQKFGMPECGMLQMTGVPCPTCGCTTAVTYFAHGNPVASFVTQPFGFMVALLGFVLLPLTGYGLVTGKWKGPSMFVLQWHWQTWVYGGVGILLAGWAYKIIAVRMHWVW